MWRSDLCHGKYHVHAYYLSVHVCLLACQAWDILPLALLIYTPLFGSTAAYGPPPPPLRILAYMWSKSSSIHCTSVHECMWSTPSLYIVLVSVNVGDQSQALYIVLVSVNVCGQSQALYIIVLVSVNVCDQSQALYIVLVSVNVNSQNNLQCNKANRKHLISVCC